jgi:hypothetical protein
MPLYPARLALPRCRTWTLCCLTPLPKPSCTSVVGADDTSPIATRQNDWCRFTGVQDLRALQEIQDELVEAALMKAPADAELAAKGKAKAEKAKKKAAKGGDAKGGRHGEYREYVAPSGLQILLGRNNKQNDEISTRVANGAPLTLRSGRQQPGLTGDR